MSALLEQRLGEQFSLEGTPYRAIENIGKGAYGVVCKAHDTAENRHVAIKKIPRAFTAVELAKRSLREVRILRDLAHENIVSVLDMFTAPGHRGRDIYVVLDLMETDLHQIIHSSQQLVDQHFQYFLYQILRGLKYLHSVGIVHRDLKPSNLFVNSDCLLKIGDFGMARSVGQCHLTGSTLTQYVSTRWYRAPELLFSIEDYNTKVDIWSAGCIFAEMLQRRQLFPGKDKVAQVKMIVYYLGTPSRQMLDRISCEPVLRWIESCGRKEALPWDRILPMACAEALHMIERLLNVCPWDRCSAEEALSMSYLSSYHDKATEPVAPQAVYFDADAIERLAVDQLKEALLDEAEYFETIRGPYNIREATDLSDEIGNSPSCSGEVESSDGSLETASVSQASTSTCSDVRPGQAGLICTDGSHPSANNGFSSSKKNNFTAFRTSRDQESDEDDDSRTLPDECPTPLVSTSDDSADSASTMLPITVGKKRTKADLHRRKSVHHGNGLLGAAEHIFPGCSNSGVNWSLPEDGTSSAPPTTNPCTSVVGRHLLTKALERRIEQKERMLRDALRKAYSQQKKRRRTSDENVNGSENVPMISLPMPKKNTEDANPQENNRIPHENKR